MIAELYDTYYENQGFSSIRSCVRGIVFKGDLCAMVHIQCEDVFGVRDHYEISGGGIEHGETEVDALQRELLEELGVRAHSYKKIGTIIDRWNILGRINVQHFYVCDFASQHQSSLTEYEQSLIKGVEWRTVAQWRAILREPCLGINAMIHRRELLVLDALETL